jgi:hypothetical protein
VPEHLVAVALGQDGPAPQSVKAARAVAQDAQDALDAMTEAHAALETQFDEARNAQEWAASRLQDAMRDVIRTEPAIDTLVEDYESAVRHVVDLRRALDFLASQIALPKEHQFCRCIPHSLAAMTRADYLYADWSDLQADRPWREFVKGLETDADAELLS